MVFSTTQNCVTVLPAGVHVAGLVHGALDAHDQPDSFNVFARAHELRNETTPEAKTAKQAAEAAIQRMDKLFESRGRRYKDCMLSNFHVETDQQQSVVDKLRAYCEEIATRIHRGENILLFGPVGSGKDHLLMAVAKVAIAYGFTVNWRDGADIFADLRDGITVGKTEVSQLNALLKPDVLVISDPTIHELTDYQRTFLLRVIDKRYAHYKPTWVSANVKTRQELEQRIGEQVVDRLGEGALSHFCNWESYRKRKTS